MSTAPTKPKVVKEPKPAKPAAESLDMSPQDLADALESIPILEHWIRSVKSHAFDMAKAGTKIPGWKVGWGVRKRIWQASQEKQIVEALAEIGVTKAEIYSQPELLSPPKIEALLKLRKLYPAKPRNGDRPPSAIDPFITKSMPEPALVRENEDDEPDIKRVEASEEFK